MRVESRRPNGPVGLLALLLFILSAAAASGQQGVTLPPGTPKLKAPIFTTTCGQSPGALMVKVVCRQVKIACEQEDLLTADELAAKAKASPIGTLFITTGTSLKGMGAAGIDLADEVQRCQALVAKARELGMRILVGQIEGPSRRTDEFDEQSIRAMTPLADLLITRADVNGDNYFTKVAEEKKIPQIFIKETLDLTRVLPALFAEK
jgi:hypothetical protein